MDGSGKMISLVTAPSTLMLLLMIRNHYQDDHDHDDHCWGMAVVVIMAGASVEEMVEAFKQAAVVSPQPYHRIREYCTHHANCTLNIANI